MTRWPPFRTSLAVAASCLAAAMAVRVTGQAPTPFPGLLDEHPAIQYGLRPTTDSTPCSSVRSTPCSAWEWP